MKRIMLGLLVVAGFVYVAMAGPEWIEGFADERDAGSLPETSQDTEGDAGGSLTRISGRLEGPAPLPLGGEPAVDDFEDMYEIFIESPGIFTASTSADVGGFTDFDSQLFLFDSEGNGLLANDNDAAASNTGASSMTNVATDGTSFAIQDPGLYYLAIAPAGRTPESVAGALFDFDDGGQAAAGVGGPACSGDPTNLLYPLDGSYMLVDFFGDGPTGSGPAQGPDQHNDDDSATVVLPFTFDLYGQMHTTAFVNNNGNLSFGQPFSTFTASGFPVTGFPMIAPFWADVDTGNPGNPVGDVWMKFVDSNGDMLDDTLVVTWDDVGYFNENGDLRNTFQVAISDGSNPVIGLGLNVAFSYDNMCWTTGDASGGEGGYLGTPATAGANRGDGTDFFQVGRFDHPGDDYDGPGGNPDGVDWLDDQVITFNTSTTNTNIDPVAVDFPPGGLVTVNAGAEEVVALDFGFIGPEELQTVDVSVNDLDGAGQLGLVVGVDPGNPASVDVDWAPACNDEGTYQLEFTATDNFNPPGSTVVTLTIVVECIVENTEVSGPDGPGAGEPIEEWTGDPAPVNDGNYSIVLSGVGFSGLIVPVDIKPGGCPNPFNRSSNGVLPVGLLGAPGFDVTEVDLSTLRISRADGVGGLVAPNEGPPGPHTVLADVGMPFDGPDCDCHAETGDGLLDVSMHFRTQDVVSGLELGDLPAGELVELVVSGELLDGTSFQGSDCIRLVPPGTPPGMLAVSIGLPEVFTYAAPLDLQLDGGGFGNFDRTYPQGTVVTVTAQTEYNGRAFRGWRIEGGLLINQPTIPIVVSGECVFVEAVYESQPIGNGVRPISPQGTDGGRPLRR